MISNFTNDAFVTEVGFEPTTQGPTPCVLPIRLIRNILCGKVLSKYVTPLSETSKKITSQFQPEQYYLTMFIFGSTLVGEAGFEPAQTDSKPVVLPLDDSPIVGIQYVKELQYNKLFN